MKLLTPTNIHNSILTYGKIVSYTRKTVTIIIPTNQPRFAGKKYRYTFDGIGYKRQGEYLRVAQFIKDNNGKSWQLTATDKHARCPEGCSETFGQAETCRSCGTMQKDTTLENIQTLATMGLDFSDFVKEIY